MTGSAVVARVIAIAAFDVCVLMVIELYRP
jgi:hypothetical protein